jgi:hypothetical protein
MQVEEEQEAIWTPIPAEHSLQRLCLQVITAKMEHIEHTLFSRWASDSTLSLHTAAQIVAWAAHCNQLSDTLLRSLLERGSLRALPLGDDAIAVTDKLLMRYPEDKAQDLEAIELGRAFLEAGALIRKIVTTGGPNLRYTKQTATLNT